jgi:hypothetical protein
LTGWVSSELYQRTKSATVSAESVSVSALSRSAEAPPQTKAGLSFIFASGPCLSDGDGRRTERKGEERENTDGDGTDSQEEKETAGTQDLRERLFPVRVLNTLVSGIPAPRCRRFGNSSNNIGSNRSVGPYGTSKNHRSNGKSTKTLTDFANCLGGADTAAASNRRKLWAHLVIEIISETMKKPFNSRAFLALAGAGAGGSTLRYEDDRSTFRRCWRCNNLAGVGSKTRARCEFLSS